LAIIHQYCSSLSVSFTASPFNSVYFLEPNITNLPQRALQSVHIDIPVPKPHIGSEKLPRNRKNVLQGKKGRNLEESNRGGSLSRMDRSNRCHVYRRNHYRVITHSMSMTEYE